MNAVLAAELNERRAGIMFSEDRDDLRLGDARRAHISFLFGLSAGETHDFKWPGLPGQRQFRTLDDARQHAVAWRHDYNTNHPHSSLDDLTPEEFARRSKK